MSTALSSSAGREMEERGRVKGGRRKEKGGCRERFLRWLEVPGRETKRREPRRGCLSLTLAWGRQEGTHEKITVGRFSKTLGQK